MATDRAHMQVVFLRRLAMARAAFELLAGADVQEAVLKVMNAEPGCREAGGLSPAQEASLLAAINEAPYSAQAAADAVSAIIAANHADDELAGAAADIDLIATLHRIERLTHFSEDRATDTLSGTSIEAKHAAAAQAIFALRAIRRMAAPLTALLRHEAHDAGHASSHAAAAE